MATAGGHIQVTTVKENENYARLSRAIVDLMTFVLREILMLYILPTDVERKALPFGNTKLKNLRTEQWDLIHKANTNGYADFDITLLYALLRNLCTSVPNPSTKWGRNDLPKSSEVTLGDDIERIRIVKNCLQSHTPTTILNDSEFEDYWKILRDVCVRFDSLFNKKYTHDLDKLKTTCMDSVLQKKYSDNLKLLRDREIENLSKIQENSSKIKDNTRAIMEHTGQIKENTSQIKENTSQLMENTSQIKENINQIKGNTSQIKENTSQIKGNTGQIKENTGQIQENTGQIQENTGRIKENTGQIKENTSQIKGKNQGRKSTGQPPVAGGYAVMPVKYDLIRQGLLLLWMFYILRAMGLSTELLGQGYVIERLKSSLRKLIYGQYGDHIKQY